MQNFRRDLTLHSAKLEIKRIFRESFRLTASRVARDKPWSTLLTSPICVLCDTGQDMTAAHLDECSALNDLNCIVKSSYDIPVQEHISDHSIQNGHGHELVIGVAMCKSWVRAPVPRKTLHKESRGSKSLRWGTWKFENWDASLGIVLVP
ncbi:hypothetical protein TNCV_781031 [Trichonephila clavipes]|nr:hypothetical protein TNCV_781031 [Trichonephila clavipes]